MLAATTSSASSGPRAVSVNYIYFAPFGSRTSVPSDISITVDHDPAFDRDIPVPVSSVTQHLAPSFDPDNICGQIDTGAGVSCTNLKFALHKYSVFTKSGPSPVSLQGAFDSQAASSSISPKGEGFLQIPALD